MKKTKKRTVQFTAPKKAPLSRKILEYLTETSLALAYVGARIIINPRDLRKGTKVYDDYLTSYLPKLIANLKNSPYFSFDRGQFYVTKKGRMEIIRNAVKNKKNQTKKWDGIWRGIVFDIPEVKRKDRDFLRRELSWMGCKEVQKSVWITPIDIEKELVMILSLWKKDFSGDIRFLRIQTISEEKQIKEYFKME